MEYLKHFEEFKQNNKDFQQYYNKLHKRQRQQLFTQIYSKVQTTWSVIGTGTKIGDIVSDQELIDLLYKLLVFLREHTHKWNKKLRPETKLQELLYIYELVKVYGMKYE